MPTPVPDYTESLIYPWHRVHCMAISANVPITAIVIIICTSSIKPRQQMHIAKATL